MFEGDENPERIFKVYTVSWLSAKVSWRKIIAELFQKSNENTESSKRKLRSAFLLLFNKAAGTFQRDSIRFIALQALP